MQDSPPLDLGRRERQIMEVIYRLGRASASQVLAQLPDPPSYSAVRGMLRLLEDKGHLDHAQEGIRHVYFPTVKHEEVRDTAMKHVLRMSTLFLVWQQQRSGFEPFGEFELSRDANAIFRQPPDNIFVIKASYWIGR